MPDSFAESADGVIITMNGIDRPIRWDGFTTSATPAGVEPPDPAVTPTVAATGTGAITGTYRAYVRFVDRNGNVSNLSAVSAEIVVAAAGGLVYGNLPVPQQATVARRQILRNTDGQMDTFYVDVDSTDTTSASLTGTSTDADLAAAEAVPLLDDDNLPFADSNGPPPSTKPFLAFHLSRMWAAGEQPYAEGSCQVAAFSKTVTGIATDWKANWPGRFLYVQGATKSYEIDSVDPVAQTLVLVDAYEDATDLFAQYSIKPAPGDAASLYFTPAGRPEAWPPFYGFAIPEDGDQVTGLLNFSSFLWLFKRKRTYRLTAQANPIKDGFIFYALGRGCVNHRCGVVVEDKLYLLDEGGVYRTSGGDDGEHLSAAIQNLFRRGEPGAINWSASRYFHCCYSPGEEVIRWFVTRWGEYLPRHSLTLHYKTGRWTEETYPVAVPASCVGRVGRTTGGWGDDGEQLYLGGPAGTLYISGGALDGVADSGPTIRGTATAAGVDTLTDSAAAFDTAWANVPVSVTAGRGKGQHRLVVAATATRLRVSEAWSVKPDATSQYQVGGIPFRFTGGRLRYAPGEDQQGRSVEVQFAPTALPQTFDLRIYQDFSVVPRPMGREVGPGQREGIRANTTRSEWVVDLSKPPGHVWQRFDGHREGGTNAPRLVRVQMEGVSGPEPVVFGEMVVSGVVR